MIRRGTGLKLTACVLLVMLVIACVAVGTASASTTLTLNGQSVTSAWYGVKASPNINGYVNVTAIVNAFAKSKGFVYVWPEGTDSGYGGQNYAATLEVNDPDPGVVKELDITAGGTTYVLHDGDEVIFSGYTGKAYLPLKSYSAIQSATYSVVESGLYGIPAASVDVTSAVIAAAKSPSGNPYIYAIYALPTGYSESPNLNVSDPAVGYVKALTITYTNAAGATSTFTCYDFNKLTFVYPMAVPGGKNGGSESFPILNAALSYFEQLGF